MLYAYRNGISMYNALNILNFWILEKSFFIYIIYTPIKILQLFKLVLSPIAPLVYHFIYEVGKNLLKTSFQNRMSVVTGCNCYLFSYSVKLKLQRQPFAISS